MRQFLLSLIALCSLVACSHTGPHSAKYKQSLNAFNEGKEAHNNSYRYTRSFESWVGYGTRTTVEVREGKVTKRSYQEYHWDDFTNKKVIDVEWTEEEVEIGTKEGAKEAKLLGELYVEIKEYLKVNPSDNEVFFKTNDEGIFTLAGHVPKNCADDCFIGIELSEFKWLE